MPKSLDRQRQSIKVEESMKEVKTPDRKNEEMETENIKPGGLTDGIMKEEAKTDVTNQRIKEDPQTKDYILPETENTNQKISEDPETVNDILPEDRGEENKSR